MNLSDVIAKNRRAHWRLWQLCDRNADAPVLCRVRGLFGEVVLVKGRRIVFAVALLDLPQGVPLYGFRGGKDLWRITTREALRLMSAHGGEVVDSAAWETFLATETAKAV